MKKVLLICFSIFFVTLSLAQIRAVTDAGDVVILNKDGSWKYLNDDIEIGEKISTNKKKFNKEKTVNFLIKSQRINIGCWIDTKAWRFEKSDEDIEFMLSHKKLDTWAMMVTEKTKVPLENLKNIALINARSVAPDARIVAQEYRNVNGVDILMLQIKGTIEGINFIYYGYYYSFEGGTVQLVTYTSEELFPEYKQAMEELLNGLVQL